MRRAYLGPLLLLLATPFLNGCTALLWDKSTFARHCRPADPPRLALFYSAERKDLLVQYDEKREQDRKIHRRCYWLEKNIGSVRNGRPPHFVTATIANGLDLVPCFDAPTNPPPSGLNGLYAVAPRSNDWFTLYAEDKQLESYGLPKYNVVSGTGKKILLTPLAVAGDATLIGAVGGLILAANSSDSDFDIPDSHHRKPKPK